MRPQDIIIGTTYRHRDNPNIGYATAVELLKPGQCPNNHTYTVIKCEWTYSKDNSYGMIKYFKPYDLIEEVTNE
jgi:hypothetical protein